MPQDNKVCNEVLNEIISRYSRAKFEENGERTSEESEIREGKETETDFWSWFCEQMKDKNFKNCFENSDREDFYGSLKTIREEYPSRCKGKS